eukprot:43908_1
MSVWSVQNQTQISLYRMISAHSTCVWGCAIVPGKDSSVTTLATCSEDQTLRIWDLSASPDKCFTGRSVHVGQNFDAMKIPPDLSASTLNQAGQSSAGLRSVAVSRGGKYIALGSRNGEIRVFSTEDLHQISHSTPHKQEVVALDFSELQSEPGPEIHTVLASGSTDGSVALHDGRTNFETVDKSE